MGTGGLFTIPLLSGIQKSDYKKQTIIDQLPPDKVKDFVIAGLGDLEKVKSMLREIPTLIYATATGADAISKQSWKEPAMLETRI
ncbi:MAG: hypothetical protein ABIO76_07645 [Ginsengibacter sp.]